MGDVQRVSHAAGRALAHAAAGVRQRLRGARVDALRAASGAAIILTTVGLALRLAPALLPRARAAPLVPLPVARPAAAVRGEGAGASGYASVIRANIFSPTRSEPRRRFQPQGSAVATRQTDTPPAGPALRLYGITVGAQGALALIDADPGVPGAEIYRVGDLVAGARLVAITDSTVTLAEPWGPLVLRLNPTPRRKP